MKKSFLRLYDNVFIRMDKAVPADTYKHSDRLGAGAAKRKKLKNPDDKFAAVMHEFKTGKLHSGSGAIVTDPAQARAIAGSESGKFMKEGKKEYALDSEQNVRDAISHFSIPRNHEDYDKDERRAIAQKICTAAQKYNIKMTDEWRNKFGLNKMQKASDTTAIQEKIIAFLKKNPNPKDEDFHKFVERLGKEHSIGEQAAYKLLGSIVAGGLSNKESKQINPEQLAMGIKVEMEHTNNKLVAEKIARDHLTEFPDYYTALAEMEKNLKMNKAGGMMAGHKYVRRVPKASGKGYTYFYKEAQGQKETEPKKVNDLSAYTEQQHEKSIEYLSKLPLSVLRKKQSLIEPQRKEGIKVMELPDTKQRGERGLKNLSIMEDHYQAAIDIKEFGDSTPAEWAKKIFNRYKDEKKPESDKDKAIDKKEPLKGAEGFKIALKTLNKLPYLENLKNKFETGKLTGKQWMEGLDTEDAIRILDDKIKTLKSQSEPEKIGEMGENEKGFPMGWRLKKDGKGKYTLTDPDGKETKFKSTPDKIKEWAKDQQKRIDEYKSERAIEYKKIKIDWKSINESDKNIIEADTPTQLNPNGKVTIVEQEKNNILVYSSPTGLKSDENFIGRFSSIEEAKNKIQTMYDKEKKIKGQDATSIKKIKDEPNNETWEIKKDNKAYRVNKSDVGWRISDDKGEVSILGLKFADTPEKAIEIRETKSMTKAATLLLDALQKAKAVPVGTVSGQYKKVAEGKWERVKSGKGTKKEPEKKDDKKGKQPEKKETVQNASREKMKGILKKMASILADAFSGKSAVQPAGEAIEQTGENIKPTNKKKVIDVRDRDRKRPETKMP